MEQNQHSKLTEQEQLLQEKTACMQLLLAQVGISGLLEQNVERSTSVPEDALKLVWRVSQDQEDKPVMWLSLQSRLEPGIGSASVDILFYTADASWRFFRHTSMERVEVAEADIQQIQTISQQLELPTAQEKILSEREALRQIKQIVSYVAARRVVGRPVPPTRKLFLRTWSLSDAGEQLKANLAQDTLFFLKGDRTMYLQGARAINRNGERLAMALEHADADGRVLWSRDGEEYPMFVGFLKKHGLEVDIPRRFPRTFLCTEAERMIVESELPLHVVYR